MPIDRSNPWKTLNQKKSFENDYFHVTESDVITPSGDPGYYGVIHFKRHAVGVVPIDAAGNTWLVGQYRYPHDTYEWEIPEGGADPGETLLECAQRELREETGIVAARWDPLQEMQVSNSVTTEISTTYIARELTFTDAQPEPTEQLAVRKLPLAEAIDMAIAGEIRDSISVAALLKLGCLDLKKPG
ncbi:MAG: 8-oxo-dGTP pyrophosphatase MutT (NUDIX family) [Verrucomicrobiales bacterium]|jgi:8-oxo-dGTP pyrophosphatase MutT (NUDIX family)